MHNTWVAKTSFEWDKAKDLLNQEQHGVPFSRAQFAFIDPHRIIAKDLNHSDEENRFFCFGKVEERIITVRFTYREQRIRIFGAGYWRRGKKIYEQENSIHK